MLFIEYSCTEILFLYAMLTKISSFKVFFFIGKSCYDFEPLFRNNGMSSLVSLKLFLTFLNFGVDLHDPLNVAWIDVFFLTSNSYI